MYATPRNRIRMYPSLVNCTTIDWFSEWPREALLEVAERYLENMDLADEEVGALIFHYEALQQQQQQHLFSHFYKNNTRIII